MSSNAELINEFIQESQGHIGKIEAGLLCMDEGDHGADTLNEVFRAVHSIKGTAGFFELAAIVALSHAMETLLSAVREGERAVTPEMVDALLAATDELKIMVANPEEQAAGRILPCVNALSAVLAQKQQPPDGNAAWGSSADEPWDQPEATQADKAVGVLPQPAEPAKKSADAGEAIRVRVELLDDLLNLAGEMVLRRNQLLRIVQNAGREVDNLDGVAEGIDKLTANLLEKVMKARMQPVANLFNKFPRMVREVSRKLNKDVELILRGTSVELDRSIIEALTDPMTHLVRNALDHGLETPQIRRAGHKSELGRLVLHAHQESGRVLIDVRDDGAGIDLDKIRAKVVQNGWLSENDAGKLRDSEVIDFMMRPGFSTAEQVTDISGRGVGLDVVKTNIEKLGGKIEIRTILGDGTNFRLILPLTLAIISAFIVEMSGDAFAVPQASVKELLLLQPEDRQEKTIEFVRGNPVLRLRGRLLPLIRLCDVLGVGADTEGEAYFSDLTRTFRILVMQGDRLRYGLVVDAVYDTEEILIKPVPSVLNNCGYYSGVTVLGDGRIALIINPESLQSKSDRLGPEEESDEPATREKNGATDDQQYLLLFRCSGGELLGVDLSMVSRVEEVPASRMQKIGSKFYFIFQGKKVRLIRPEHYLPLRRRKNELTKVYVLLPKLGKNLIGVIAEEIVDAVLTEVQLDTGGADGKGIIGTTLLGDTIVTLVDICGLLEKAVPETFLPIHGEAGKAAAGSAGGRTMQSQVILLVEDTPFFARTTQGYLESEGYEVILAENGRRAWEILQQQKVDLVISDIEMPVMNGIELVREIRASEKLGRMPVIALTSLTGQAQKEQGLRAGFDRYEFKLNRIRLLESVAATLRKKL